MNLRYITSNKIRSSASLIEFSIWERKALLAIIDFLILFTSLFFYYKSKSVYLTIPEFIKQNTLGIIYAFFLFGTFSIIFNLYNLEFTNKTKKVLPLTFFIGILFTVFFIFTPIITPHLPKQRIYILGFVFGFTFLLSFWRITYTHIFHGRLFLKKLIILISSDFDSAYATKMKNSIEGVDFQNGYKIQRIYSIPNDSDSIENLVNKLDAIIKKNVVSNIIILDKNHENVSSKLNKVLISAIQYGVNVQTYLKLYEDIKEALPLNIAGRQFYSIFPISRYNTNYIYYLSHRLIDVISSIWGLIFTVIFIPFIFLINLFINRGPLFYSQKRVGKGGKEFEITKFRSMIVDAEKDGAKMSVKGDVRITRFGKFLRKLRIDEFPQFWAVLKGDMSLIGPRPERKIFIDKLAQDIPFYNARHLIRPGITGWAQVKYPYGENLEDSYNKLEYDLYYIKNRSVTLDIRIIFKTINTIIFSKGQ